MQGGVEKWPSRKRNQLEIVGSTPTPATKQTNIETMLLPLRIKKEFFDLIESGEKKTEYRDCTDYYISRFVYDVENVGTGNIEDEVIVFKPIEHILFMCGKKTLKKQVREIELDEANGYFLIHLI